MKDIHIRNATIKDAGAIGSLHAVSWIAAYRGILSDEYLDNDLESERQLYWDKKLNSLGADEFVLVATIEKEIVGFICVLDRPENGYDAFVDNLHAHPEKKGSGIGSALMRAAYDVMLNSNRKTFYLWVLKGNDAAEGFYASKGGKPSDVSTALFGGKLVEQTRYVWDKF